MGSSHNELKTALARGELQYGLWCSLASNVGVEVVAGAGFDWLLIDVEHSPNDLPLVLQQLQAVAPYDLEPIVRVPCDDPVLIKQYLDVGARSLLLPTVETADQARQIVEATRYPPNGIRGFSVAPRASGFGRRPGYHANAEADILVVVQIESPNALGNAGEIASVDGVDALFVGPGDLSATMGHLANPAAADVQAAIKEVAAVVLEAGKPMGVLTGSVEEARRYIEWGYRMVGVGSDLGLLRSASDRLRAAFQDGDA